MRSREPRERERGREGGREITNQRVDHNIDVCMHIWGIMANARVCCTRNSK